MRYLEIDPPTAGLGEHRSESLRLQVVERMIRFIATGQVGHDAANPDRIVGDRARQRGQHRRVLPHCDPVAVQPGVDLDRHLRGAAGAGDRTEEVVNLSQ